MLETIVRFGNIDVRGKTNLDLVQVDIDQGHRLGLIAAVAIKVQANLKLAALGGRDRDRLLDRTAADLAK